MNKEETKPGMNTWRDVDEGRMLLNVQNHYQERNPLWQDEVGTDT
jgi:hypothetical protein